MAGRKTKLTPAVQEAICQGIRAGNFNQVAAAYAGVSETSFYQWLARGEETKSGIYAEFAEAVKEAAAAAETRNVALIEQAAQQSWQAAAWWLERKHYERWGRKERQELTGPGGGPLAVTLADVAKRRAELEANGGINGS